MRRSAIIRWRSSVMRSSVVKGTGSEEPQEPAPHDGAGEYPLRAITDSDRPYWKELRPTTLPRSGLVQLSIKLSSLYPRTCKVHRLSRSRSRRLRGHQRGPPSSLTSAQAERPPASNTA